MHSPNSERKTAVILGTSRPNGNTRQLVNRVDSIMAVDVFTLHSRDIHPFDYDHNNHNDDFIPLIEQLLEYEHWVFASPVYWYCMSAQMKTFVDRLSDLLTIRKDLGRRLRGKSCSVISTSETPNAPECFETVFKLTFDYLGMEYKGMLYGDFGDGLDDSKLAQLVVGYVDGVR
jgi:multimeric flavodoxin WrbA